LVPRNRTYSSSFSVYDNYRELSLRELYDELVERELMERDFDIEGLLHARGTKAVKEPKPKQ
jgi:hypothetical protein